MGDEEDQVIVMTDFGHDHDHNDDFGEFFATSNVKKRVDKSQSDDQSSESEEEDDDEEEDGFAAFRELEKRMDGSAPVVQVGGSLEEIVSKSTAAGSSSKQPATSSSSSSSSSSTGNAGLKPRKKRKVETTQHVNLPKPYIRKLLTNMIKSSPNHPVKDITEEGLDAVEKVSETFFHQMALDLLAYSNHAGRRNKVTLEDMECLMRRQRLVNDDITFIDLIKKHLGREYSEKVISKARKWPIQE